MAVLALAAPTAPLGASPGAGTIAGLVLPAAEANALATFTGFSVPNNGSVLVRVTIGVAGAGNISFLEQKAIEGATLPSATFQQAVANSTAYIFGPFRPSEFNDVNGLLQVTLSVVTGNFVGVYAAPASQAGS